MQKEVQEQKEERRIGSKVRLDTSKRQGNIRGENNRTREDTLPLESFSKSPSNPPTDDPLRYGLGALSTSGTV